MCTWEHSSHCGNWVSVWCFPWGYQRKEWLYGAQPPFFSSPSPNPFSTISSHAGAKAAASSPLHPMCTRSVPQSGSWQSWQCHRHVPWRGIFGWLSSAACQGGAGTTTEHKAPSVVVQVNRAEGGTVPSYQSDLQLPAPCSAPLRAFWHYCRVATYYYLSSSFYFLLK